MRADNSAHVIAAASDDQQQPAAERPPRCAACRMIASRLAASLSSPYFAHRVIEIVELPSGLAVLVVVAGRVPRQAQHRESRTC